MVTIADAIMAPRSSKLRVNVILEVNPNANGGMRTRVARRWFEEAWSQLGGELKEALARQPLPAADILKPLNAGRIAEVMPELGAPWVLLGLSDGEYRGEDIVFARTMSDENWPIFLDAVSRHYDDGSHIGGGFVEPWDPASGSGKESGWPKLGIGAWVTGVEREPNYPNRMYLTVSAHPGLLLSCSDRESALCDFLLTMVNRLNPQYGEINIGPSSTSVTMLSQAMTDVPLETNLTFYRSNPREVLQGYSWVTILPREIGRRLGGVRALRDSGAFHDVIALERGGYWLKATEQFRDYGPDAVRKVFEALRPVLPEGCPSPSTDPEVPDLLVLEDARMG